jgi:signal transduction histidine kinase
MNQDTGHPFITRVVESAIDDIGTPPDTVYALQLTHELPFIIVIKGADCHWQSEDPGVDLTAVRKLHPISGSMKKVRLGRQRAIWVEREGYNFYFIWKPLVLRGASMSIFAISISAILAALLLNYYMVRRLLKPITLLKQGAEKISGGDIDYRIDHTRDDELGELTQSINTMADSLQSMLNAKLQLLLAISHELRSPITRAKLQLELMDDSTMKDSLKDEINELESLVSELLEAERLNSQHGSLNQEPVFLGEFIEEELKHHWPNTDLLKFEQKGTDREIDIDVLRTQLMLRNLVNNALRYGGDATIHVGVEWADQTVTLSVVDQGEGIEADHLPHLTEPFYRADRSRQRETGGFGLGLYLCRLIAKSHGGDLSISSQVGQGTTIAVCFPTLR